MTKECNPHPNAPHGYLRDASHNAGRYVCECEWWSEKDYKLATLEEAEEFAKKRDESLNEYMKQAQELWNDSCTAPRKPKEE